MYLFNLNLLPRDEWPENTIYIGRAHAGRGLSKSKFANPFPLKDRNDDVERHKVLEQYRTYFWEQIQDKKVLISELQELDGCNLACFCAPKHCHGMIIQKAVEWARDKTNDQDFKGLSNPLVMPRVRSISEMLKF